jgi:hypothetical protein
MGDRLTAALLVAYAVIALAYGIEHNWPKVLYWSGALMITTAVLWMR